MHTSGLLFTTGVMFSLMDNQNVNVSPGVLGSLPRGPGLLRHRAPGWRDSLSGCHPRRSRRRVCCTGRANLPLRIGPVKRFSF
ncbi:MAG: hypothetical protein LUQ60_01780 [Methanomicrobiales archaeon]|nr:hypothetical protein [Methanomicrobiales archaeon]